MGKKLCFLLLFILLGTLSLFPEEYAETEIVTVFGPRVGVSYYPVSSEEFSEHVSEFYDGEYNPVYTLFGAIAEQRILLGETRNHFALQEILLIGGLEQAIAIPVAAFLMGYRDHSGFEFGVGPIASLTGIGVICAIGWTFSYQGVFVPIDLHIVLPNRNKPAVLGITTGFNFTIKTSR